MTSIFHRLGLLSLVLCVTVAQLGAQQVISQDRIIQWLSDPDLRVRSAAVANIKKDWPPSQRSAELDMVLAKELERLNTVVETRREVDRKGSQLDGDFPFEYYGQVAEVVAQSTRADVLPSLAGALGTGGLIQEAFVKFGDKSVQMVVPVARKRVSLQTSGQVGDVPPNVVADALGALRLLIRDRSSQLSAGSKHDIAEVARERLSGAQEPSVVAAACGLAVATGDPILRQRVSVLASSRADLLAMKISKNESIGLVQQAARAALAGRR